MLRTIAIALFTAVLTLRSPGAEPETIGRLVTRWAKDVTAGTVHPEYPRPMLVRSNWINLNGRWDYAVRPRDESRPERMDGQILVPFAVESQLSGVRRAVGQENLLWYQREFDTPQLPPGGRLLLHFGAVDWHATVWINDIEVGQHKGGYDSFSFDITDALSSQSSQKLVVRVWDPTDKADQPRGKQVSEPRGIWYTSVTGIWRTVWLETVPADYITSLRIVPDIDHHQVSVGVNVRSAGEDYTIRATVLDAGQKVAEAHRTPKVERSGNVEITLPIKAPKLWSPESPHLYDLHVSIERAAETTDLVHSYFGMRKISLAKDEHGMNRLLLNNEPLFQFGPLDQGWWPDGLYTAPTDEALKYDIEVTKRLGFNMLRKHVKVEPARFYYHCDRLGILVWQDMPSGFHNTSLRVGPTDRRDASRSPESSAQFETEYKAVIENLLNHPSIVVWVPFNEGWGQYDTERIAKWTKQYDPSRLCNPTSGWTDRGVGDMFDAHMYPGPGMEPIEEHRAVVLGEFGGLGWPVENHLWWNKRNWGYRTYRSQDELWRNYRSLIRNLHPMIGRGLAAAIYTQTTDVEGEVNGLMTYDREVIKFDPQELTTLHRPLYGKPPVVHTLVPDSELAGQSWRYTDREPSTDWKTLSFDDSQWPSGQAPLAHGDNPHFPSRSSWTGANIWLRSEFKVEQLPDGISLKVYSDGGQSSVYINGQPVADFSDSAKRHYLHTNISEHTDTLRVGKNVIAVHARNDKPRRGIDVGLYGFQLDEVSPRVALILGNHRPEETIEPPTAPSPLKSPFGIDFDSAGNMFIVELEGGRVHRLDTNGHFSTIAGDGSEGYTGDGGPAASSTFNGMHNVAVTPNGDIYIADSWNHCIRKIDHETSNIVTIAGTGQAGFSGDGRPATRATFDFVMCITLNAANDNLYVADLRNRRIRVVDLATGIVRTVAGNGEKGVPSDGAQAVNSPLVDPRAVAVDSRERVYILERGGHALRRVDLDGRIHTVAGTGQRGGGDGPALQAQLDSPKHLCVDDRDNVFIADDQNRAIRKFDPRRQTLTTVLGHGLGRPAVRLSRPHGVCFQHGQLYVVDTGNDRILRIDTPVANLP